MDREGFRNRLKQYKEARGLNPLLKYWEWRNSLPDNLKYTNDAEYDMQGAYEAGMLPEWNEQDQSYHLGSRDPRTGRILKKFGHPTYYKALEEDAKMGYKTYVIGNNTYTWHDKDGVFVPWLNQLTEEDIPKYGGGTGNVGEWDPRITAEGYDDEGYYAQAMNPLPEVTVVGSKTRSRLERPLNITYIKGYPEVTSVTTDYNPGAGALDIVSPEFDLFTLGRGLLTNLIKPKGKIGKLPIDKDKYYREVSDYFYGKSKNVGAINDIKNSGVVRTGKYSGFKSPMFSKGKIYDGREGLKDSYYIVSNDKKGLTWTTVDALGVPNNNPKGIAFTPLYNGKYNVAPKDYFDIYKYLQDDLYLQIIPNHKVVPIAGLNAWSENIEGFADGGEVEGDFLKQFGNQIFYKPLETSWWSDVKNWWNNLTDMKNYAYGNCAVTPDGKHTTQCAHYSNAVLRNQGYKNIVGDAWTRAAHSGMKKITSGYDGLIKPEKWNEDDAHEYLQAAAENFTNKVDTTALNPYDVIGLYYPDSPNTKKAFELGKWGETQTHTGHIVVGKDGTHYVVHNVDGHLKMNKLADMLTGDYEYLPVSAYRPRK